MSVWKTPFCKSCHICIQHYLLTKLGLQTTERLRLQTRFFTDQCHFVLQQLQYLHHGAIAPWCKFCLPQIVTHIPLSIFVPPFFSSLLHGIPLSIFVPPFFSSLLHGWRFVVGIQWLQSPDSQPTPVCLNR